eukprot:gene29888-39058_t
MIISGFAMYVWAESLEASGSDRHDDMICFKTVYPLLSLAYPDHLANIIQADAIVKGVSGFDIMLAKDALLKDAFEEPPKFSDGAVGKLGLKEYMQNGFVLSALGLYSVTPGTKGYVLGSPLFRHVRISRDPEINVYDNYYEFPLADEPLADKVASKGLDIVSKGAGSHVCMVEKVMLNGTLISGSRQLQHVISKATSTCDGQRAQAAAAKKAVPVKVTIAEPERNTHKVEENLTEGNSLFDLHHPLGVIAIIHLFSGSARRTGGGIVLAGNKKVKSELHTV